MATQIVFNAKDQKIRKNWLIALLCMLGYEFVFSVIYTAEKGHSVQFFVTLLFFSSIAFGLLYYTAYKKNGYRFLVGLLISSFFRFSSQINSLFEIQSIQEAIGIVCALAFFGWWYYASIKLISVNMKHRKLPKLPSECLEKITVMKNAQSCEDLDNQFHTLMREFPQFEPVLSKEYQEKKDSFLSKV